METDKLLKLYDQQQRRDYTDPRYEREVEGGVVRHVTRKPGRRCFVTYADMEGRDVEQVIQEQLRHFEELGSNFEWPVFDHDQPPDLLARLETHGFEIEEEEAVLVLDLNDDRGSTLGLRKPSSTFDFRRISSPNDLVDVLAVEEAVYDTKMSWLLGDLEDAMQILPDFLNVYVTYDGTRPVSAAWSFFVPDSQFVGLYGGATLPDYRGVGLYSALLDLRAQEARQRGRRFLTVGAGELSRPILMRRGFRLLDTARPCVWNFEDSEG